MGCEYDCERVGEKGQLCSGSLKKREEVMERRVLNGFLVKIEREKRAKTETKR